MHHSKAQGATEYLVVLGAVLLVSVVVVQAVSSSSSSGIELREQQSDAYWKSATPFSISSYTLENGLLAATIRNQLSEPLKLTSVQVVESAGASTLWSGSTIISGGSESTLFMRYGLNNSCKTSAGGTPFEITQITFTYDKTSVTGLKQIGDRSLAGKCAAQQGIVFRSPAPSDGASVSASSNVSINATLDGIQLKDFGMVWNGTNYSFYDDSLVLAMNFDDVHELGEKGGKAVDVSRYGNNGTIYGNTVGIWHFDEADGNTAFDESRFGNNGTVYGNTVMLLHMDENIWNTTFDESAYKNNGTCYNMNGGSGVTNCSWVEGKSGAGINFDGVNDYINTTYFVTNAFSVSVWLKKAASTADGEHGVVSQKTVWNSQYGWTLTFPTSEAIAFYANYSNTAVYSAPVSVGVWHHAVGTFDGSTVRIYLDGVLQQSTSSNLALQNYSAVIGRASPTLNAYYFNGSIDETAIYNRSLSPSEVLALYSAGKAKFAEWTSGKSGTGLAFDGIDDYLLVGTGAALAMADNDFAMDAWVKLNAYSPGYLTAILGSTDSNASAMIVSPSHTLGITKIGEVGSFSSLSVGLGVWTHVAITFDSHSTTNNVGFYVNGLRETGTFNYDFNTGAKTNLVGKYNLDTPDRLLNGTIDEVGIYNRSLSAAEVLAHYNAGRAKHADWAPSGRVGSAMQFDGVNDYVNVTNSPELNFSLSDNYTLSAWVLFGVTTASGKTIVEKLVSGPYPFALRGWSNATNGGAYVALYNGSVAVEADYSDISPTGWHHLVAVKAGDQLLIYGDGELRNATAITITGVVHNSANVFIGRRGSGATPFNGSIDEVRIWNRALSGAEARQQYYSSLNKFAPGRWLFSSNQTFLPAGTHTYYLYANATDGSQDFTEERTLRVS